jgi:transcriptional regulator with XRE-family HTH domain
MAVMSERPEWNGPSSVDVRLQRNLRRLRHERALTLAELSDLSLVSRAMISKIERGTAVPTATVLGKLAAALKVGLSQLVGDAQPRMPTLLRQDEQATYRDPQSGLERRSLSPVFPDRCVDFVMNTLPAGGHVVFPGHRYGVEEYLFVRRGTVAVVANGARYTVSQGDTLFYPAHEDHEFHNETPDIAEFFIIVDDTCGR